MKKPDPDTPILTKNEKEVLKNIIFQAKTPDTEIARKMRLTQQGVYKIRSKLEKADIIQGYMPIINYKRIGIKILVLMTVKVTPGVWKELSDEEVSEKLRSIPCVITVYRIPESDLTHIIVMGFKDIAQKDRFLIKLQTKHSDEIDIKQVYPFSVDRIITNNPLGLFYEILDDKEYNLKELFLKKHK